MIKRILFSALAIAVLSFPSVAKDNNKGVLGLKNSITDSNIVFPESFETDTQKLMEGWYLKNYTGTDTRYRDMEDVMPSDEVLIRRLADLPTVIEMPFNQIVKTYIDRYTRLGRGQVATMLGLNIYYMPIFEQALEERGLPLELKYLPVIESGLDPNAVSKHGATGLWQFMLATARGLGMEVSSLVDERRDPYISSEKAADYLQDLFATYNDWGLAIAAYNCGPGAVNKAIRRAGGDPKTHDFWSIYNYLSPETRGYVPMFIAANYVMTYYPEHNIGPVLPTKPLITDTLHVSDRVHFNQISAVLDIPVEELRTLNPQFRADLIPGTIDHPYNLILPSQQIHAYIMSEENIKKYDEEKYARRTVVDPGSMPADALIAEAEMEAAEDVAAALEDAPTATSQPSAGNTVSITHKVAPGETLASIAQKYNVSPADVKTWNNLRRNAVRIGQILRINTNSDLAEAQPTNQSVTPAPAPVSQPTAQTGNTGKKNKNQNTTATGNNKKSGKTTGNKKETASKPVTHQLKSGDNLSNLAKRYGVTVDEIKKANNMQNDNLRAGETIKIPAKKSAAGSKSKSKKSSAGSSKSKSSKSKGTSKKKRKR